MDTHWLERQPSPRLRLRGEPQEEAGAGQGNWQPWYQALACLECARDTGPAPDPTSLQRLTVGTEEERALPVLL